MRRDPRGWPAGFGEGASERQALLILSHLETMTPRELYDLAWLEGSAQACLKAVRRGAGSQGDRRLADQVDAVAVRAALASCGARAIGPGDSEYPPTLLHLTDPPASLFVRGRPLSESNVAAAVVGARSCSDYGREIAIAIGRGLADVGVTVVSGAARGVDSAAHRGAVSAGGPTTAVLGSGIDVAYPSRNRRLIEEIIHVGTVVSEYPPGAPALPRRFPARNRLIAALGGVLVVVEGAAGSGSLITTEFALDLGREVFAVPGPVTSLVSAVPHQLIREGATLARGAEDILDALGVSATPRPAGREVEGLSSEEGRVLETLAGDAITAEVVAGKAHLPISTALSVLVSLEVRGLIRGFAGRYRRTAPDGMRTS